MIKREEIERRERELLAPYAAKASESRGRIYPQPEHPLRTAYQRDRDRIVHSTAFRRMEYKTQVFLPHVGDHFRTRLTHTIEVAQVARTLARNLRLNEDLTETIALVHDLGHTPFGHAGEDVLDELLANAGGFNHNRQSLRVVDLLEQRYREHPGLNLTFEVREGIVKHETKATLDTRDFEPNLWPTLEASLVDMADSLTYSAHDIDDGMSAGLIELNELAGLDIWRGHADTKGFAFDSQGFRSLDPDQKRHQLVRYLINTTASDLLTATSDRIDRHAIGTLDQLRRAPERLCDYSGEIRSRVVQLKGYLMQKLYRHPKLVEHTNRAKEILSALFTRLSAQPTLMPQRYQEMLITGELPIVVADYIAGMTDRYAENLHARLTDIRQ